MIPFLFPYKNVIIEKMHFEMKALTLIIGPRWVLSSWDALLSVCLPFDK